MADDDADDDDDDDCCCCCGVYAVEKLLVAFMNCSWVGV